MGCADCGGRARRLVDAAHQQHARLHAKLLRRCARARALSGISLSRAGRDGLLRIRAGELTMSIGPTILEYLADLEGAVGELANTWHPDDPAYRADVYRQAMTSL